MALVDEQKTKLKELIIAAKLQGLDTEAMAALSKYIASLNVEKNNLKELYAEIYQQNKHWDWGNNNVLIWLSVFFDLPDFYNKLKKLPRISAKLNIAPAVGPYLGVSLLWLMVGANISKKEERSIRWQIIIDLLKKAPPKSININALAKNSEDKIPLWFLAVIAEQVDILKLLVEKANTVIDFNSITMGENFLCQAFRRAGEINEDDMKNSNVTSRRAKDCFEIIEILLKNGPESIDLKKRGTDKKTLLWLAVSEMPPGIVKLLVEKSTDSVDPNDPSWAYDGKSLLVACGVSSISRRLGWLSSKVKILLNLGANPEKDTSLEELVAQDYQEIMQLCSRFQSEKSVIRGKVSFWNNELPRNLNMHLTLAGAENIEGPELN